MRPVLLNFVWFGHQTTLLAYPTMLVLAGLAAVSVASVTARSIGLPWRRAAAAFGAATAAAVVGARLLHVLTNLDLYASEPARTWAFQATGFALYGGLLVGGPIALLFARSLGLRLWSFADAAAVGVAAGVMFMRAGCFLQGCCYGRPTSLPWAITFPPSSPAWTRQMVEGSPGGGTSALLSNLFGGGGIEPGPVHPTQLYELAAAFIGALIVAALLRRRATPGTPFLTGALWFTTFRLINAQLRWPPSTLTAPAWFYPALYVILIVSLAGLLSIRRLRGGAKARPLSPPALGTAGRTDTGFGFVEQVQAPECVAPAKEGEIPLPVRLVENDASAEALELPGIDQKDVVQELRTVSKGLRTEVTAGHAPTRPLQVEALEESGLMGVTVRDMTLHAGPDGDIHPQGWARRYPGRQMNPCSAKWLSRVKE